MNRGIEPLIVKVYISYCATLYCIFYGSEEYVDFLNTLFVTSDFSTRC